MIFLHLESFDKLLELDFSIFQKARFYGQSPLGRWIFLHGYDIFFSTFLLLSIFKKTSESNVSDHFVEKIRHESTTLNAYLE